jgi:hypothetical protein
MTKSTVRDEAMLVKGGASGARVGALAACFAAVMMLVPWEWMAGRKFEDKEVYLERFGFLKAVADEQDISSLLSFYTHEVLWDNLIRGTSASLGIDFPIIFGFITFSCLFLFARFLVKRYGPLSILFLLSPLVVDFAFSQLRLAFAISLLLFSFDISRRSVKGFFVVVASFIHSAVPLFVLVYFFSYGLRKYGVERRLSSRGTALAALGFGVLIALLIGPFREALLSAIGDRRAEYTLLPATLSYTTFWIGLLLLALLQGKRFYSSVTSIYAVVCVAVFVSSTIFGVNALRFISASFPGIVGAIYGLRRIERQICVSAFILYTTIQWYFWVH